MTKKKMINEMINLGILKETDKSYILRNYTKRQIEERLYNESVPQRIEYLKSQGIQF